MFVFRTFDLLSTIESTEAKHYVSVIYDYHIFFLLLPSAPDRRQREWKPKPFSSYKDIFIEKSDFQLEWLILVIHHCRRINLDKKFTICCTERV